MRGLDVAVATPGRYDPSMTIRVALLAAECEPWAKTGGLADVVDALARALGKLPETGAELQAPVDVFLPRYRSVTVPVTAVTEPVLAITDPRGGSPLAVTIVDVAADGYRLRLVDVPAAFDRDGFYDHPDDPWRFTVFCRAALAALKRDGAPLDVLHVHDWHTGPALLERARGEAAGDPFFAGMAVTLTLHNLAYHGWTDIEDIDQLGLAVGDPLAGPNPDGVDLLLTGIRHAELVNTVSPGFAAEALTPAFGMGLDGALRGLGDRFFGILNGIDPEVWDPATDPALAAPYARGDLAGKAACRADLLTRVGFDPDDDRVVLGMIGRMDPQKGFDLLANGARRPPRHGRADHRPGQRARVARGPVPCPRRGQPDARRAHRALRPGHGAAHLRRRGPVPDAEPVRALRPGPDDRAALRHATGRAPDGRPRRFRRRRP